MPNLARVRTTWNGTPVVGPGVSTFYFAEASSGFVAAVSAFFVSLASRVPATVLFTTLNSGDLIDIDTGAISGTWTDGSTGTANSNAAGAYAQGVGVRGRWATSGLRNGRRVRGSTFIVPLTAAAYAVDGTIDATVHTAVSNAFNTLFTATAPNMRIYSRPGVGGQGQANTVIGVDTPDKVSWLRSRRV